MSQDQTQMLFVRAEAIDTEPFTWYWAIYRVPDLMLILKSRPEYADQGHALEAGRLAAVEISGRLGIPIVDETSK